MRLIALKNYFPKKYLSAVIAFGLCWLTVLSSAHAGNQVVAWGAGKIDNPGDNNDFGQSIIPATLTNAVFVAGGWRHSLALNADGTLQGWCSDSSGQLDFPVGSNYVSVACGRLHSLALQSDSTVLTVGDFYYGQLDVPLGLSNVVAVACGWYHSLALTADGTVVAWGAGSISDPSDGTDFGQAMVPAGLSNVVAIAGGAYHSLALRSDGTVVAWGAGTVNNPGDGYDVGQAMVPAGLSNVVAIAGGGFFSVALEATGKLVAWGDNAYGETNIPVSLTNGVVAIAAGGWHNLALKMNGTVVAWGAGIGSDTNIDYLQSSVPSGLTNVVQVAAGLLHSLALVSSGPPTILVSVTNAVKTANGFSLKLPTRNGRVYQLQYKDSLTNTVWQSFPLQAGTGGPLQLTDTNAVQNRFYRVSRW